MSRELDPFEPHPDTTVPSFGAPKKVSGDLVFDGTLTITKDLVVNGSVIAVESEYVSSAELFTMVHSLKDQVAALQAEVDELKSA